MTTRFVAVILLFTGIMLIANCKKDPKVQATPVPSSSFTASVDSVAFTSDLFSVDSATGQYLGAFATIVPGLASQYQLSIVGQKYNPNDAAHTAITLFTSAAAVQSFSGLNPQGGTNFCLATYAMGIDSVATIWLTDSSAAHAATVTITSLDTINKLVSGTFSFAAYSAGASPTTHIISQGKFTNVPIKP